MKFNCTGVSRQAKKLDLDAERKVRSHEEMAAEAAELRPLVPN